MKPRIPQRISIKAEGVLFAYREGKKKPNQTYQHKHLTLPVARCWRLLSKDNGNSWEVMSHERYNNQIRI
ncbi:ParE family toxin-like protein [Serratia marcescens]|uniref:ParE family toxin-like protein n=1 Tax=Serratia marcescens TaxID=615 RepID=UPI003FCE1F57